MDRQTKRSIGYVAAVTIAAAAMAGLAGAQVPTPEHLRVSNRLDEVLFTCGDVEVPLLFPNHRYIIYAQAVEPHPAGYQFKLYTNDTCTGPNWEPLEWGGETLPTGFAWYGFLVTSRPDAGYQCYQARAWEEETQGERTYGLWSECCCFQIVDCTSRLGQSHVTDIGGAVCGGTTYDLRPTLTWTDVANEKGYDWAIRRQSDGAIVTLDETTANDTSAEVPSLEPGDYIANVKAFGRGINVCDAEWSGDCLFEVFNAVGEADFEWWPQNPKMGERVRFADLSTGLPETWSWAFDDGVTSTSENPVHVFGAERNHNVRLDVTFDGGQDDTTKVVTVSGSVLCGDDSCQAFETAWSCPSDCALDPGESGRTPGSDSRPTVPAAVGGVAGESGTFWKTEGSIFNPNDEMVTLVLEYTPMDGSAVLTAGPFELGPENGLYWDNIVEDLFGVTGNGGLWLDSSLPVIFHVRSYNDDPSGTFGQGVPGIRERLTLGLDEGEFYLIGLRQDEAFRTNIFFQEVDGQPIEVRIDVYDVDGNRILRHRFPVNGHSEVLKNLGRLGLDGIASAYARVRVMSGTGRVAVIGSVIDQVTGDPTSIDPVHLAQIGQTAKSQAEETHELVAVVAHTEGQLNSLWRSEVDIVNPTDTPQTVRIEYKPQFDETSFFAGLTQKSFTILPGEQKSWSDVLVQLFGAPANAKTQGSFHVYSAEGVIVHSRVYNQQEDKSTLGQVLPALSAGDMIAKGKTGKMIGLRHTQGTRTNVGLAEYSGEDTEVEISFFTTRISFLHLGTLTETVTAKSHVQLTRVFQKLGLSNTELKDIVAYITVNDGGSIYAYGSVVDNGTGDATTYLSAVE